MIEKGAARNPDAPALLSETESLSFQCLAGKINQYSRWALYQGIQIGDVVALVMPNRPEYFAAWLGITAVGGVVALLNTNLRGSSLRHCITVTRPKHLIADSQLTEAVSAAVERLDIVPHTWAHGIDYPSFSRLDTFLDQFPTQQLTSAERRNISIDDLALHIYTSGTTGLPKAANLSHGRIMQWAYWFAGMLDIQLEDRIYDCLPMYHSIGGVLVPGAALVSGASVVIRETFSARQFWEDLCRWDCTIFQYIGELCRYLLNAPESPQEHTHRIRAVCGNGLSAAVWREFQERFAIPRVLEFYASTEGGLSLFNAEGEPGAIGRVPQYLAHRYSPTLVRFDPDSSEPIRDGQNLCIRCSVNEPGEALARLEEGAAHAGGRFEGYTDSTASERKILRNVFAPGDAWVRTGDLMRVDERGFYYFVDRIGDTFRWKGENVATTEVAEITSLFPGVIHAVVYGVKVTAAEGRVGMAALTIAPEMDLDALRAYLNASLPSYAKPAFLRIRQDCDLTGTFKYSKSELVRQGFNPNATSDIIYFDHPGNKALQLLDQKLFDQIESGLIRL